MCAWLLFMSWWFACFFSIHLVEVGDFSCIDADDTEKELASEPEGQGSF